MKLRLWGFLWVFLWVGSFSAVAQTLPQHPRLWITPESLARYQSWATASNPFYAESLLIEAEDAKAEMDAGLILNGDTGSNAYEDYVTENYALLFAFMSLIHPDEQERADYAQRSRTLLMHVITQASLGVAEGEPFRSSEFSINDRSRWNGVAFPLTVDWIYPILSKEDKALIHAVFSRWMSELRVAYTTNYNHPEPVGVVNDPILTSNQDAVRWSGNNYYTAHMRNMGMMALALDPSDDPTGAFATYLSEATGAWLYVNDALMRTDAKGGFGTEGFEYSPQSLGYVAQFLLALHTSQQDDATRYGQQVVLSANPFWEDSVKAYVHSISPDTVLHADYGEAVYQPAWYGSGQDYQVPDFIELFGALGVYDDLTQNAARLEATRWIQTFTLMGGQENLIDRSNDASEYHKHILYYMLFDPNASTPADPRPNYPTTWYASGMRRLLSRTDWTASATWLTYSLTWNRVDHQAGNGNAIEFYRQGEWLTKVRVGYDLDYLTSDNFNTLTVQNDDIDRDDFRLMIQQRGSQWLYSANDPQEPLYSDQEAYLAIYGDATPLYNTDYEGLAGVTHVSRFVVWLKPDVLVIYDRAVTERSDSEKRFILNLPYEAVLNSTTALMTTPKGQQFVMNALLPVEATLSVFEVPDEVSSSPAHHEIIRYRYQSSITAPTAQFLHVLQGVDSGQTAQSPYVMASTTSSVDVAIVGEVAVSFPREALPMTSFSFEVPLETRVLVVAGLLPQTAYQVQRLAQANSLLVTVSSGTGNRSDSAGVLWIGE